MQTKEMHLMQMAEARRVRVLLNSKSGSSGASTQAISSKFKMHGSECLVTMLDQAPNLRTLAITDDEDIAWIAAGGDGTVNCVAGVVAGTNRAIGVLPFGTLNHFAQDAGIEINLEAAVATVASEPAQTMDAAEVNGRVFVNNSSLGFYPEMVTARDQMCRSGANKWWAMLVASVKAIARFRCLDIEFECEGQTYRHLTPMLFVGNNKYDLEGGGLGKRSHLDEGVLSLVLASHTNRLGLLRLVAAALAGRAREDGELKEFTATSFTVRTRRRHIRVSMDGEVERMTPPLLYKSLPGALRVIAPVRGKGV